MHAIGLSARLQSGRFNLEISWPNNPAKFLYRKILLWIEKRSTHRRLLDLDDHMLRDIGMDELEYRVERRRQFSPNINHPML